MGLALPHSLIFFMGVGVGCLLVALKETKKRSRNGTSSPPPIPPRDSLPPRAGTPSAGVGKFARPQPGPQPPPPGPAPAPEASFRGGHAHLGRPSRGWGAGRGGGGRGPRARAPGAQRRGEARRPAPGGRAAESPAVAKRVNRVPAARRAEPAPRPAYWASARRDRGLQQITN